MKNEEWGMGNRFLPFGAEASHSLKNKLSEQR